MAVINCSKVTAVWIFRLLKRFILKTEGIHTGRVFYQYIYIVLYMFFLCINIYKEICYWKFIFVIANFIAKMHHHMSLKLNKWWTSKFDSWVYGALPNKILNLYKYMLLSGQMCSKAVLLTVTPQKILLTIKSSWNIIYFTSPVHPGLRTAMMYIGRNSEVEDYPSFITVNLV